MASGALMNNLSDREDIVMMQLHMRRNSSILTTNNNFVSPSCRFIRSLYSPDKEILSRNIAQHVHCLQGQNTEVDR